ncbi:MAG: hypothetical protein VW622_07175 [Opitutae bacterium]
MITLSLFFYGAYYQDIQDESQMPLTLSYEENFSEPDPEVREGPESTPGERASETFADSDHWAEHRVLLVVENGTPILTSLHSDALQSPVFLDKLIEFLGENPTAKELILSPFQSNAFKENETQILRPLFSTRPSENRQDGIYLVCRGHSIKSSRLLTNTIMKAYVDAAYDENMEQPLIHRFKKYNEKIKDLEESKQDLLERIHQNAEAATGANVEEIAIQSELMETTNELGVLNKTLSQIDSIHKKDRNPLALLVVERVANHKTIPDLTKMARQLKEILANQETDPFVRKEVSRNLEANANKTIKEIADAIAQIKTDARKGLERKKMLEEKMIDLRAKEDMQVKSDPKYALLDRLNKEIISQKQIYFGNFEQWNRAKKNFRFENIILIK